jgi:hypothetical protein
MGSSVALRCAALILSSVFVVGHVALPENSDFHVPYMAWTNFQVMRDSFPGMEARLSCIASSPGSNFGSFRIEFRSWYIRETTVRFQWSSNTNSGIDTIVVEPDGLASTPMELKSGCQNSGNRDITVRPLSLTPTPLLGATGDNLLPRGGGDWSAWKIPSGELQKLRARAGCVNGGSLYGHWNLQFESDYDNGPVEFDWNVQWGYGAQNWVHTKIDPGMMTQVTNLPDGSCAPDVFKDLIVSVRCYRTGFPATCVQPSGTESKKKEPAESY